MHRRLSLLNGFCICVVAAAVFAPGCSSETGLLIEVTSDVDVKTVRLMVAYELVVDGAPVPGRYRDTEPMEVDVSGRDMRSDPYKLLLKAGDDDLSRKLLVVGIGESDGETVAFGTRGPLQFTSGETRKYTLSLGEVPRLAVSQSCVEFDLDGGTIKVGLPGDLDCDGSPSGEDCADEDPARSPNKTDVCGNGIDEDCDNAIDENVDEDGDGEFTCDGDCDDFNAAINSDADDVCDGVDNNCNGLCDEDFDADDDLFTVCGSALNGSGGCRYIDDSRPDCDEESDDADLINPGAEELCDGIDNNCNDLCDEKSDEDGDLFTTCGTLRSGEGLCAQVGTADCADDDEAINPAAREICDGVDNDCDAANNAGVADEANCFSRVEGAGDACFLGSMGCDDTVDGDGVETACTAVADASLESPPEYCDAFAACSQGPELDECAADGIDAVTTRVICPVLFDVDKVCPTAAAALPVDGVNPCTWRVIGGTNQAHYGVGGARRRRRSGRVSPLRGRVPGRVRRQTGRRSPADTTGCRRLATDRRPVAHLRAAAGAGECGPVP